jgi:nesprin-2
VGQKIIKDDIKSLKHKQKDLESRIESAKQETENCLNSLLKSECLSEKDEKFALPSEETQGTRDVPEPTQLSVKKLEGDWEVTKVRAGDCAKMSSLSVKRSDALKSHESSILIS